MKIIIKKTLLLKIKAMHWNTTTKRNYAIIRRYANLIDILEYKATPNVKTPTSNRMS